VQGAMHIGEGVPALARLHGDDRAGRNV
jgi:hypothetical protein